MTFDRLPQVFETVRIVRELHSVWFAVALLGPIVFLDARAKIALLTAVKLGKVSH